MGSNIEKDIYDFSKNYTEVVFSKKRPPLDFELNELQKIQAGIRRKHMRDALADGPTGDGFLVEGTGNSNEIRIRSGALHHKGHQLTLEEDLIISTLVTPSGSDRTDIVYAEWYLREVDSVEDPALIDTNNIGVETAVRTKMDISVFVAQGTAIPSPAAGRSQYRLATLNRLDGVTVVDGAQTVDDRLTTGLSYVLTGGKVFHTGVLAVNFEGGSGLVGGNQWALPNQAFVLGPNEVRYMYVSDTENLTLAATLPTSHHVALAKITTDGTDVTSVEELRRFAPLANAGTGDGDSALVMTALAPILEFEVVRVSGANTVDKAEATGVGTMPVFGIALDNANGGEQMRVLTSGVVRNTAWSFTAGAELYADLAPGTITETPPSAMGEVRQKVGIALTSESIYFNPDLTYDVVGGVSIHTQNTDEGTTMDDFTLRMGATAGIGSSSGYLINPGGGNPEVGVRFNGTYMEVSHDGVVWEKIGVSSQSFRHDTVGDGIQTVFVLPQSYEVGADNLEVFISGLLVNKTDDYLETNDTTVTFLSPPADTAQVTFKVGLGGGDVILDAGHTHTFETGTGDGLDATFTLANTPLVGSIQATIEGLTFTPGIDFNVAGNVITFTTIPQLNDRITVFYAY